MPTAELPYQIGVKLTGGTAKEGYVLIRNARTKEYKRIKTSSYEAITNLTKLTNDGTDTGTHTAYAVGDLIEVEASGNRTGSTTHTVISKATKGGETVKLTCVDVSTTNAPAVSIG